ncbi:TonB-dependent receptor [Paremcibacter congregatus]|uniref:TonB-dependent receptor n=1 Tax=Paremcibacter congregatus TaxID=2043170 RepID=UPI0030ED2CC1|tara:strand:+ start:4865 stop:7417 length:2553 start_codon:yes stop_codon:yes gene_type:complete
MKHMLLKNKHQKEYNTMTQDAGNRVRISRGLAFAGVSLMALCMSSGVSVAQEMKNAGTDAIQLEEIVVHGQRKEQSILEVPVSSTVFGAEKIDKENITDAKGYLAQTPNVSFQQGGRNGQREIIIAIRGISDIKGSEKVNQTSAFATYFNDFGLSTLATGQPNPSIYDAEAVEVLAGPQGVFFGRNSEGGALVIHSKKPDENLYGRIDAGYGTWGTYTLGAVANVPITDTLFARVAIDSSVSDGPFKNAVPGKKGTGTEYMMARGQIRWEPTENTRINLLGDYTLDYNDHQQKLPTCVNTYFGGDPFDQTTGRGIGCYDLNGVLSDSVAKGETVLPDGVTLSSIRENRDMIAQDADEFSDARTGIYILNMEHDFSDNVNLTSITGFVESEMDQLLDLDGSGRDFLVRHGRFTSEGWSHEMRLTGTTDAFEWMLGGIYYKEENFAKNDIEIRTFLGPWMKGDFANENEVTDEREGWAIFGNVEYDFSDALSLIVGGRYSHDKHSNSWDKVYSACANQALGSALADGCSLRPDQVGNLVYDVNGDGDVRQTGGRAIQDIGTFGEQSGNDFSYRVALNWNPNDDFSAYASIAKGYKPSGARANPDSGLDNVSLYNKERLMNYEVGFNAYFMDRRARISGAVFYMDWRDMQVEVRQTACLKDGVLIDQEIFDQTNDPATCVITPIDRTENAEKATSKGFEISGDFLITEQLKLSGSLGILDAKFVRYIGNVKGTDQDLSGSKIGAAPSVTASAAAEYTMDALGGELSGRIGMTHRSSVSNARSQASLGFPTEVPAFTLVNAGITQSWENHRVSLNVSNLLDKEYFTSTDNSMIGRAATYNPRRFTVRWTMEFGG